jgi:uncharacterized OB-fold protein
MDQPTPPKPRPVPTPASAPFWDALRRERISIQRCDACGRWVHYPRRRCSHCLSERLSWHDVSGSGTVYTFTVARQPSTPVFADEVPQIITVVELDDGPRLTTTLVGADPDTVEIGMRVDPVFDHGDDGVTLLRFRLAPA